MPRRSGVRSCRIALRHISPRPVPCSAGLVADSPLEGAGFEPSFRRKRGYLSSQTSSKRQPLYWLLVIKVRPLTSGCQQVAARK